MQYRWRCTFRDAYYVCKLLWPYAHTKLPKIQQVIEHYATERLKKVLIVNDKDSGLNLLEEYSRRSNVSGVGKRKY